MDGKQPQLVKAAFGKAVKHFRTESGMSQEKLAHLAGMHRNYVGDVERGVKNICLLNMSRVSQILGVPLSQIMLQMEQTL